MAGKPLAVGEPVVSRSSGALSLSLGRPIVGRDGTVRGVVAISTRLERIQELLTPEVMPPGSVMTLANENGAILARSIDPAKWIGRQFDIEPLRRALIDGEIVLEMTSPVDGVMRLSAFVRAAKVPWVVYVGVPTDAALAHARTEAWWRGGIALLTLALALALAWSVSRRIARPVQELSQDAKRLGAGDLSHRTRVSTANEIGVLAESFNRMADALDSRTQEAHASEAATQKQLLFTQTLIDTIPNPVFFKDHAGRYLGCNKAFEAYIGIAKQDLVGKTAHDIAPKDLADRYKKADDDLFASGGMQVY